MTRRVRFTPFIRAGVFCAGAALLTAFEARAADIPFATQPPISTSADGAESVVAADVDGDGDTDVVSASFVDDKLAWYENTAGNGTAWTTRTISTVADGAESVVAADVDGDGDTDVVSASFLDDKLAWYENTAGNGTTWTTRTITTLADGAAAVFAGDVDGDGNLDLVVGSTLDGHVAWYENTAGNGSAWTKRTITTQAGDPTGVAAGDVDGDGDLDVLSSSGFGHSILWYENTSGAGTAWTTHTVATALYNARSVAAADVDGDGDTDILAAVEIPGLVWYENAAGTGTTWTQHAVQTGPAAEDAFAVDLDRDGDLDVVSSSSAAVHWHENTVGSGTAWTSRTISTAATGVYSVSAADVDGDGDPDVLSAAAGNDSVVWHRNGTIHESACFVQAPPVSTSAGGAYSVTSADVDGDGDADVLAASRDDDKIAWHENLTGSGPPWAAHTITTAVDIAQGVVAADVDGDGDTDAFSTGYYAGLRWHRNDAGNGTAWTHVVFGSTALGLAAADVDGDGDVDAIESTNFFDPFVKWYENTAGNGSAWSYHTIAQMMGGASRGVVAADLDGDGDTDVLSNIQFAGLLWFENVAGNGSTWTTRSVAAGGYGGVAATDIDGDGDLDVVADGPGGVAWHENTAGNGTAWTPRTVGTDSGRSLFVADLDRDGDADVLRAGNGASSLLWHENTAGSGLAWAPHVLLGASATGTSVSAADLDGDGDKDVLATTSNDNRVSWFENRGGQFSLLASDTSPGGAINGDVVAMLRVVVTHLGRTGDSDLELSSLGLLLEETAGDPLTSAEANALIETLQVYADANGNGVFDPSDTLVASVPTLALVNGVQSLAFTDNDPNLMVSLGTPRAYFVVTELTANASTQSPNRFRVTHLGTGPSASTAEDRASDIRLRPACPADVAASLGPITPVELIGFTLE